MWSNLLQAVKHRKHCHFEAGRLSAASNDFLLATLARYLLLVQSLGHHFQQQYKRDDKYSALVQTATFHLQS